jgi:hypothetical protein
MIKFKSFLKENIALIIIFISVVSFYLSIGCPIRYFFGISCMGCGMTRAMVSLLHFDFVSAFNFHPLIFAMPIAAILILFKNKLSLKFKNISFFIFAFLFFAIYFYRLFFLDGSVVYIDIKSGKIFEILSNLNIF